MADITTALIAWMAANATGGDVMTKMRDALSTAESYDAGTDLSTLITQYDFNSTDPGGTLREMPPGLQALIEPMVAESFEVPADLTADVAALAPRQVIDRVQVRVIYVVTAPAPAKPFELPADLRDAIEGADARIAGLERTASTLLAGWDDVPQSLKDALSASDGRVGELVRAVAAAVQGMDELRGALAQVRADIGRVDQSNIDVRHHSVDAYEAMSTLLKKVSARVAALEAQPVYVPPAPPTPAKPTWWMRLFGRDV